MAKSDNALIAFLKSPAGQYVIAGGLAAIVVWYLYGKAKNNVEDIIKTDLNPASDQNLVNSALSSIGKTTTGNPNFDFDEMVSRWFKSDAEKQVDASLNPPPEKIVNP